MWLQHLLRTDRFAIPGGRRNAFLFPERVFLPRINQLLDDNGNFKDATIPERLRAQAQGFIQFVERLKHQSVRSRIAESAAPRNRLAVCSWSLQPQNPRSSAAIRQATPLT